jgi:hypothetical protein
VRIVDKWRSRSRRLAYSLTVLILLAAVVNVVLVLIKHADEEPLEPLRGHGKESYERLGQELQPPTVRLSTIDVEDVEIGGMPHTVNHVIVYRAQSAPVQVVDFTTHRTHNQPSRYRRF